MLQNKTQPTEQQVEDFLNSVENDRRREDSFALLKMMRELTGEPAVMWGSSIVGFGTYHYTYDSGREGDHLKVGFSPRKSSLSLYIMPGFERYQELLEKLGKHKTGKSCLYINKLADVDLDVLQTLIRESVEYMNEKYG
jgi:hypothetical protein